MPRKDRNTPEYRAKAAERMRLWRAEHPEIHRTREKERYARRKAEDPETVRAEAAERMRRWRAKNPELARERSRLNNSQRKEYFRDYNFRKRYGVSAADFDAMFDAQGSACAVCKLKVSARGWALDHDHTTGKPRGILCHPCNTALGFFNDNVAVLQRAAEYLEHHS